jgi:hypothetical protein
LTLFAATFYASCTVELTRLWKEVVDVAVPAKDRSALAFAELHNEVQR